MLKNLLFSSLLFVLLLFAMSIIGAEAQQAPAHPCEASAILGDYNCDGRVNQQDFDGWLVTYQRGTTELRFFEYWRRATWSNGPTTTTMPTSLNPSPTVPQATATPSQPPSVSCLSGPGSTITISGPQSRQYKTSLTAGTLVDARSATWQGAWPVQSGFNYPVRVSGGTNLCFVGGSISGSYPDVIGSDPHGTWDVMHSTAALSVANPNTTIESVRIHNFGDGIEIREEIASTFTIRGVYLSKIRDDCIENDWLRGGVVDDSLLDGCYSGFSTRTFSGGCDGCDGSNNVMTIQNSLIRLEATYGIYKNRGTSPGHDGFFKWDSAGISPQLALHNNVFRVDQDANNVGLGIPSGKLTSCLNNTMVWLGPGSYPDPLPQTVNGQPCFTIVTDRSVWDSAAAQWKQRHGY